MTTYSDQVRQFGGAPVASNRFEGWWGGDVFFVDYDNGSAGVKGTNMDRPQKHLRIAISDAGYGDTIYVKPRTFDSTATYPEDPRQITPDTAANWSISYLKGDLSIIGTGKGVGHAGVHQCWIGGYGGSVTDAIITVYAPGVTLENMRAQPGSSTNGIIYGKNSTTGYDCGNLTIQNMEFHDATTAGAIHVDSVWQNSIVGNRFINCDKGIYQTSYYCVPQLVHVWDNKFVGKTTEVYADFHSLGGCGRFLAYNNHHACGQPAAGAPNKYYCFSATSNGAIMNCYFAVADTTDTALFTLNSVLQGGNFSSTGQVV